MSTIAASTRPVADEVAAWLANDPRLVDDRYPLFHRLRSESPEHRSADTVFVTRYDDCAAAIVDARLWKTDG